MNKQIKMLLIIFIILSIGSILIIQLIIKGYEKDTKLLSSPEAKRQGLKPVKSTAPQEEERYISEFEDIQEFQVSGPLVY